jgi:small-conductance mechanosensitive channel
MTPQQSKQLKIGDHVCFNGEITDRGMVIAVQARYVTIKWNDGHKSFTGHNNMTRVERSKKLKR